MPRSQILWRKFLQIATKPLNSRKIFCYTYGKMCQVRELVCLVVVVDRVGLFMQKRQARLLVAIASEGIHGLSLELGSRQP